jgi:hypothetical protein
MTDIVNKHQGDHLSMSLVRVTGNLFPSLSVLFRRLQGNIIRHAHTLLALETLAHQPVTQKLLVKAGLTTTDGVRVLGPETRGVGRQDFIGEYNLARLFVDSELELGIGDDHASLKSVLMSGLVKLNGHLGDNRGVLLTQNGNGCDMTLAQFPIV